LSASARLLLEGVAEHRLGDGAQGGQVGHRLLAHVEVVVAELADHGLDPGPVAVAEGAFREEVDESGAVLRQVEGAQQLLVGRGRIIRGRRRADGQHQERARQERTGERQHGCPRA